MLLQCDTSLANRYKSGAQRSRVISEAWFSSNAYCLACTNNRLAATPANTKALDFICQICEHRYELKTFSSRPKTKLIDGAFQTMIDKIMLGTAPTLMMLERGQSWEIKSLTALHHSFLTSEIIAKRNPLSANAKRAGWTGCNILLNHLSPDAFVPVIFQGAALKQSTVRNLFQKFEPLQSIDPRARGWTTVTLRAIRLLDKNPFKLSSLYLLDSLFREAFPRNNNIHAKIRQQLQILRDLGYLTFLANGLYELTT